MKLIWQNPDGSTERLDLDQESYSLGRGDAADIRILDENASRVHARLHCDLAAKALSIEDLDSSNGVYVNGQKIESETRLSTGDTFLIGATAMSVEIEEDPDPQRTRVMSLEDVAALIDAAENESVSNAESESKTESESGGAANEDADKTHEMAVETDLDATMAIEQADIDATELLALPSDQAGVPDRKLLVVSGEPFGETYILGSAPMVIGRGSECDVVLKTGAVSGRHAQVRLDGDRVLLADLGSKNGTLLGDAALTQETEIPIGATFTIGTTAFKLLDGDTFVSGKKGGSFLREKKKLLIMAGLAVMLLVLAGGKWLLERGTPPSPVQPEAVAQKAVVTPSTDADRLEPLQPLVQPAQTPASPPVPEPTVTDPVDSGEARTMAILRETANAFMDNRLWSEAIDKLEEIQAHNPADEALAGLMAQAEFERGNQQRFDQGLNLAARKQYKAAKEAFGAILEDSVYHDEAVLELQNAEKAATKLAKAKAAPKPKKASSSAGTKATAKPKSTSLPAAESRARRQLEDATRAYVRGDIDAAREQTAAVVGSKLAANHSLKRQAKRLDQQVQKAQTGFMKGEELFKSNAVGEALKTWAAVLSIDKEIAGRAESDYSRRIAGHMADHFYAVARQAYDARNWATARSNAVKAIKARPDHPGGRRLVSDLNNQAKKLYEEGYILEDLNPAKAAERWRQVLQVGSPDNEYYRKAREKLAKYGG